MTRRFGVGRIRHHDLRTLWLQTETERGTFATTKVKGRDNFADLGTKNHGGPRLRHLMLMLGVGGVRDRAPRKVKSIDRSLNYEDFKKLLWLSSLLEGVSRAPVWSCLRRRRLTDLSVLSW